MKTPTRLFTATLAAGMIAAEFLNLLPSVNAQVRPPDESVIANFDSRPAGAQKPVAAGLQVQAEQQLKSRLPAATVDYDGLLGTPKFIRAGVGFLTGPGGQGGAVSASTAQGFSAGDPYLPVKAFLAEHSALFGFGAEALEGAAVSRDSVAAHSGLRTVVWQQQLDGLPVFESVLIGNSTAAGELVTLSSAFLPEPAAKADAGTPNRSVLQANPTVAAASAIRAAAQNLGDTLTPGEVVATGLTVGAGYQKFTARQSAAHVRLVWLPLDSDHLRLCWEVMLSSQAQHTLFKVVVDAATGEVRVRRNLTSHLSDATYNVWTSDSPSPFTPSWPTPNNGQPPLIGRTSVTTPALNTTASPNGWINDGDNETQGNNTDTFTDRNFDQQPDGPRPQGNPSRVFNFPLDLTQQPITYTNASTVQLFYWINRYHDELYQLGFTEAAGNFQNNNFGRGGLGNDRVIGYVQAGADVGQANNAFFSTPPDGFSGEMAMFIFDQPRPNRDGDLDAEVILHEATHGTSGRLVGGGVLISALQTGGMGEGWSDFVATSMLSEASDDPDAVYADGGYPTFQFFGLAANYYFGIRHFPYTTDMAKNPFTFKDIDPGQISSHVGVPRSPIYPFNAGEADEVHHQGEIWCVTLREARANLVRKYGFNGNAIMLQLVIDGMKLGPANPNFLQARDAIILADQVNNAGANSAELWRGFAKRGMGFSATSPDSSTTVGVHESYDVPGVQIISTNLPGGNGNGTIDPNECNTLFIGLQNLGGVGATGLQVKLSTTNANVIITGKSSPYPNLPSGTSATNQIAFQFSTSPSFVCGTPVRFAVVIKSDQSTTTNLITLASGSAGTPSRYDSVGTAPIPDLSSGDLPIVVTNFNSAVLKATLSIHLLHTYDSDLLLQLISPEGITNTLAANVGGSRDNFGGDCSDGSRTVFDDDATVSINSGAPPFIGTFKPVDPLSVFIGKTGTNVNGTWHLHVVDQVGIDFGTIECWSLFLTSPTCTDGGGECPGSDLAISGSVAPEPLIIGGNLVYTLNITNQGPKAAKGVTLSQSLPPSVVFIGASISQGSISQSGGSVNGSIGNLAVGGSVTATVTVLPTQSGTVTSTATTVAVSDPDPDSSNNSITLTSHINPPTSDMAIGITASPNPALVGGTLTYYISVTNNGPSAATSVVVSNTLAASLGITSATPSQGSPTILGSTVIFNLGALNPGAIATATITAIPSAQGQVTATSTVRANQFDPVSANNTASVNVSVTPSADLAVGFTSVPASIVLGNPLTYTVNATNLGPNIANAVFIQQTLPTNAQVITLTSTPGTTLSQAGNIITCDAGTLAVGGSVTMSVQVLIPASGTVISTANISGGLADGNPANNTATVSTLVAPPFVSIRAASARLLVESFAPPNGAIEPGETVTVQLYLQNVGNVFTTNLTGRLLATGGVTSPTTGSQSFTLPPGGLPDSKSYSFTASGTNGGTIVATLQLTNNGAFLTNVSFVFALPKTATFANTNVIVIPDSGIASPYPSTITVSGVTGLVGKVTATLSQFNHTYPHDVSVLLVSPAGTRALLMSHTADLGAPAANVDFTFDDSAPSMLPQSGSAGSGSWQPSAYPPATVFPSPAPTNAYGAVMSAFNNANPNGTWSLFVLDDATGDRGGVSNGWSLAITTISAVNQTADLSVTGVGSGSPILAGDTLTYTFTVMNHGTNTANAVAFTNALPATVLYVSSAVSQGNVSTNGGMVIANLGTLAVGASATVTVVVKPTLAGTLSSTATVSSTETDLVPGNNTATVLTTVNQPAADVSILLTASAGTVVAGSNLVYTVAVTNLGPETALNVSVTNVLPAGLSSISVSSGTLAGSTLTWNPGNLAAGAGAAITVSAHAPSTAGIITNKATVATGSTDSNSANNAASVATVVRAPAARISAGLAKLLVENFAPADGAVAPGETVTVSLALANAGELDTVNLMATLLNSGGVTASSGVTNYGALIHNGAAVARLFTFTASSAASGTVTATLQLQDGANNLGTVVFSFALPQTNSFANTNAIIIPDHGIAAPYPSTITVAGLTGLVSKATVKLNGVTHAFPKDIGVLLVSPSGTKSVVMSGVGGGNSISNLTLTFDDAAAAALSASAPIVAGTSQPTSFPASRTFPSPAPAGSATALLSQLNGGDPNGGWSLYVVDDVTGDGGLINLGWSLTLTTVSPVNPTADLFITAASSTNQVFVGGYVTYTLLITNNGPTTATGVVVTNVLPAGAALGSVTLSQAGTYTTNANTIVASLNSLAAGSGAMVTIGVNLTGAGLALDGASVTAIETDLNPANNTASASITVLPVIQARLAGVIRKPNGQFQFTLTGQPDFNYIIQATTNLPSGAWKPVSTNMAVSGTFQFTDTNAPGLPQRFYRAVVAP